MSKANKILELKELLDKGAITNEEFETKKAKILNGSTSNASGTGSKILKVIGIIALCFIGLIIIGIIFGENDDTASDANVDNQQKSVQTAENMTKIKEPRIPAEKVNPDFADALPVSVSGKIEEDILGYPDIICNISNLTDKNISATCLYFIPYDVYGDTINTIFTTNKLDSNDKIYAGSTVERKWSTLDSDIKSGTMYLYSVYFEDGTEWGNRNASKSDIMKYAYKFDIKGE